MQVIPKLIDYSCEQQGRYGFSIPFLIGAERYVTKNNDYSINDLLNDLKNSEIKYFISNCKELDEIIIGHHKTEYPHFADLKNYNSVYINDIDFLENTVNFQELINCITELYSCKIENELFSKNYYTRKWSNLTDSDITEIENAKKIKR
ncbi:hypothetical protein [Flavobacterium psychrophilum]|uniref:Uncharacterized protein n=1 Tax=Flavobacterium psychrophilum TaxID=96345 RepID=A0A7U2NGY0_FLAPS|nr:hypothetical protein [Flavobacterium psychrophilum]EKT4502337.1 hypothetical protein [Flavobacterium psychrophilum]OAE90488.1 hypothetical protein SU65_12180 [Flavobacterium psychrophilum]QRE04884.1 hypothetical protein H0H26_04655 [Flavobacterium psychrophilum]SNA75228.1 hypothetical protein FRGDSA1882_370003 [Flavobacterium psychrophilum]SNB33731.1 hypothetical protein NO042_30003 [Flavobacterium psychrophilum]